MLKNGRESFKIVFSRARGRGGGREEHAGGATRRVLATREVAALSPPATTTGLMTRPPDARPAGAHLTSTSVPAMAALAARMQPSQAVSGAPPSAAAAASAALGGTTSPSAADSRMSWGSYCLLNEETSGDTKLLLSASPWPTSTSTEGPQPSRPAVGTRGTGQGRQALAGLGACRCT